MLLALVTWARYIWPVHLWFTFPMTSGHRLLDNTLRPRHLNTENFTVTAYQDRTDVLKGKEKGQEIEERQVYARHTLEPPSTHTQGV